jgi:putative peptidoglycan lipid II flippase
MNEILVRGKKILFSQQESILSAATVIMLMVVASRVLGLVRQRVLLSFFSPEELSLFFAAFRLPDLVFEVLTFGALSSAFIPVFTKLIKEDERLAWDTASRVMNFGLAIFIGVALIFGALSHELYSIIAPGYTAQETEIIAKLARILFAAQGFFVISYVLTGVLESMRRFLFPALAPIFYNIGIILGTLMFSKSMGLYGPVFGVFLGSCLHFLIQLPLAYKLGIKFQLNLRPNKHVSEIGKLALPRMIELSFLEVSKTVELYLASVISTASYTYYMLANSVQLLPVGLFGVSMAKAALPTLTRYADDEAAFKRTFLSTLYQVFFLVAPMAVFLIVLRIPIVRLLFGTNIFGWEATVQTGLVVSAFAIGVPAQAAVMLLNRAFYALSNTKLPVKVSLFSNLVMISVAWTLIKILKYPTWALAMSYSISVIIQALMLYYVLSRKVNGGSLISLKPIYKSLVAATVSGFVMRFFLKFFDRSVWIKRLSFLTDIEVIRNLNFEGFVLDTRYTFNLIVLTTVTALIGGLIYLGVAYLLRSDELLVLVNVIKYRRFAPVPKKEQEQVAPVASDNVEV